MSRRLQLRGSTLRARTLAEKAVVIDAVRGAVLPLLADRRLVVPVCATFPLDDVERAYERFAAGGKLGKVVLVV